MVRAVEQRWAIHCRRYVCMALAVVTLFLPAAPGQATAQGAGDVAAWREDIEVLADTLRANHPKLLHPAVRADFDRDAHDLERRIPGMDRPHFVAELARLVARLHDGHTQVGLAWDPAVGFHAYPIRVYLFQEGVFIVRTDSAHADLLGARLEAIDQTSIDSALARLRPYVHGDNESAFRDIVASRLVLSELLAIAGVADRPGSAEFRVRRRDGTPGVIRLFPVAAGSSIRWLDARPRTAPTPLYLRDTDHPYWFVQLDSLRLFWIQFNAVENDSSESLADFSRRALAAAERSNATRLVIDVRRNNGGDNTLLRPLITGIIRSRFNAPGHLFVITGRLTFSAAMNFVTRLENFSEATFVGEPTGAPPNHYGETRRLLLPHSGITVLYSSLYWQDADPRDTRPWIAPDIPAPPSFADYVAGRDAALAAILARPSP